MCRMRPDRSTEANGPTDGRAFAGGAVVLGFGAMDAASDVLNAASVAERARIERVLAHFAKDARALMGFERLPEPVIAWATWSKEGEPGLNRVVAEGRLVFRRWEGELTPFRRRPLKETLEALLAPLTLGDPFHADPSRCEWRGSFRGGRFTRVAG